MLKGIPYKNVHSFVLFIQIFKSNEFFCGLNIPDPGTIESLEKRLPKEIVGSDGLDFFKVSLISNISEA